MADDDHSSEGLNNTTRRASKKRASKKQTDPRLFTFFREQAGVITRKQAKALGMTDRQIDYRLKRGEWQIIRRSVYRHAMFTESDEMHVRALTLGGRGYLSHRHASALYKLDPMLKRRPEVTVYGSGHEPLGNVIIHRSTQYRDQDITRIDGWPVSKVERTIMDVGAVERDLWKVVALIDSARELGLTTIEKLDQCLEWHARRGRDGTVRFRKALELVSESERPAASPFSREVAEGLVASGGPYPRMEEDIVGPNGGHIARLDLSFDVPVVVFLDGFTYHGARRQQTNRDRHVRQVLRSMGYVVLEFTFDQWREHPMFVVGQILDALATTPPRALR